jgi:hypothetical protein
MRRTTFVLFLVLALITTLRSRFASAEQTPWMHIPENSFDQGWGLDLNRLWDTGHWQEQRSLTGSWDGVREQLYKDGIAFLGSYKRGPCPMLTLRLRPIAIPLGFAQ